MIPFLLQRRFFCPCVQYQKALSRGSLSLSLSLTLFGYKRHVADFLLFATQQNTDFFAASIQKLAPKPVLCIILILGP